MAVDLPAIVVEDSGTTSPLAALTVDESRAARAFRDATGFTLIAPKRAETVAIVVDPDRRARIARIENALHDAREPLELGDKNALPALRSAMAVAYGEARAHPEDPEAPLLLAEILRTMARAEDLGGDTDGATALRDRARLLDGGRRIGLSEGLAKESALVFRAVTISVPVGAVAAIDGNVASGQAELGVGEHHVRVVDANGAVLLARWIVVGPETSSLAFQGPRPAACGEVELAAAARAPTFSVDCPSWAIVRRTKIALEVRLCGATSCAAPTHWVLAVQAAPPKKPPPEPETSVFRSPWTWIAIGAAAVAGGTIAAWRLGAFDRPEAPPPTWRWEGAR